MNRKLISFCLRTDAQTEGVGGRKKKKKITDVENWRSFSNSKQLVHVRRTGLGQGYFQ